MKANGDIVIVGVHHRPGVHLLERRLGSWHCRSIGRNESPAGVAVKANGDILLVGKYHQPGLHGQSVART